MSRNVWDNTNQLSKEVVHSMQEIFLNLSTCSKISPEASLAIRLHQQSVYLVQH